MAASQHECGLDGPPEWGRPSKKASRQARKQASKLRQLDSESVLVQSRDQSEGDGNTRRNSKWVETP